MIRQNWKELSSIQIGGAICLPLLLIGFEMGKKVSFLSAVGICLLGNGLLTFLAIGIGRLALQERTTTSECIAKVLGPKIRVIAATLIMVSMISWFSIQTAVIVQDVLLVTGYESGQFICALGAIALMVASCLYGLKAIERLAMVATPLMAVTLVYAVMNTNFTQSSHSEGLGQGFLIVVGGTIMAIIDLPTFFRTARSQKDVTYAAIASFLVGVSFVELMGAYLAQNSESSGLMQTLLSSTHPVWIALFIFIAGWTTNVTNLYSGAMACRSLFPKLTERNAILLLGFMAALLVPVDVFSHMEKILEVIAVVTIALGAEMAKASFTNQGGSWVAVSIGMVLGITELILGTSISGSALIDVFVLTVVVSQGVRRQNEALA